MATEDPNTLEMCLSPTESLRGIRLDQMQRIGSFLEKHLLIRTILKQDGDIKAANAPMVRESDEHACRPILFQVSLSQR